MTASNRATCRVRLPPLDEKKNEDPNLNPNSPSDHELHTKWANAIQKLFSPDPNVDTKSSPPTQIRNFDILLHKDGSAENLIKNQHISPKPKPEIQPYRYSPRYQLPDVISARLTTNEEKISRAELFALGSILYEISSGHPLFHDIDDADERGDDAFESEIQNRIVIGKFPEDLWGLSLLSRILVCWCPGFVEEVVKLSEKEKQKGDDKRDGKGDEGGNDKGNENRNEEDKGSHNKLHQNTPLPIFLPSSRRPPNRRLYRGSPGARRNWFFRRRARRRLRSRSMAIRYRSCGGRKHFCLVSECGYGRSGRGWDYWGRGGRCGAFGWGDGVGGFGWRGA
ncbi:hypothetical protein SS1G_05463 [Sclerotinia sclerotiorum 1980 UF-70]|uniref:Protein kinase domain-containing protein n=2 Tax=Sclerotinia sclerotiorum (strain ATCC 18683 / 1980 / Ss-1) TaxID=665079 RepID=A7EJH0_SCLS1|nr:hypothetical protein SS1G_05463 [Sclerotinia sclerotiorum 1980 UF-70]APA11924.1 hypothetical protein sscle_08g066940 [Sclerotinia sclerotiorum 1980 UF-70]EDO02986.1 hypothetical protein SS1G_05463 [Sclerotinia sclerotiorum 1980 UF-70]